MHGSRKVGRFVVILLALLASLTVLPGAASAQPFINSASFGPTDLPSTGGTITVTASATDPGGVAEVYADISGDIGGHVPMTYVGSDNWSGTFDVGPNP